MLTTEGYAIFRGLIPRSTVATIRSRLLANLKRLRPVIGDYKSQASKNVFSIALAFADPSDRSLYDRMGWAIESGTFQSSKFIAESERDRLHEEIGTILQSVMPSYRLGALEHCYARYERFRRTTPFSRTGSYFRHRDSDLGLPPDNMTAWIALTSCGVFSPSLMIGGRKRYHPGDTVLFNAATWHSTYMRPWMVKPRLSLDIRLAPA